MKMNYLASIAIVGALITFGCSKNEPVSTTEKPSASENKPASITEKVQQVTDKATGEVKQAVENVSTAIAQQTKAANSKTQDLIDQAKNLVSQIKYQDALNTLKKLSDYKLTAEQQKTVDDLQAQIQKVTANPSVSNTLNAAGGLFKH
jgi:hypothetical protein